MKRLCIRVFNRLKMTVKRFNSDLSFSFFYAVLRVFDELGGRLSFKRLAHFAHEKREQYIFDYLKTKYQFVFDKYKDRNINGVKSENEPIWICWWDGEENAPEIVKKCIESIKMQSNLHPVIFIDKRNYENYLDIPDYILEKVNRKTIQLAHLSDYIRVALLEKYGGLWLDSTIFCSDNIPEEYFEHMFFTCKSNEKCSYISKNRWVTFVLGGWKGNLFFLLLKELFENYWKSENAAIDYLMFDYLIELSCREVESFKTLIDNVPINNIHRDDLQAAMNANLEANKFETILQRDTILYKLSWRETYKERTDDGNDSVYKYFLSLNHKK